MAKARTITAKAKAPKGPKPRLRVIPDPAGRVDILAIRLLEVMVDKYGDIPLRGIYGTYKADIDRAIKRNLGKFKFYIPPVNQLQGGGCNAR